MKKIELFQELMVQLAIINTKIDKLQKDIDELKPKQMNVKTNIDSTGCLACGQYDCPAAITNLPCPKRIPHAHYDSFNPYGVQAWELATTNDDVEE